MNPGARGMKALAALLALLVVLLLAGLLLLERARARRKVPPGPSESPSAAPRRVETAPVPPVEGPVASEEPEGPEEIQRQQEALQGRALPVPRVRIRVRDRATGAVLRDLAGAEATATVALDAGHGRTLLHRARGGRGIRTDPEGWFDLDSPVPLEVLGPSSSWTLSVPGYDRRVLRLDEVRDGAEFDLEPWTPRARGVLVLPEGEVRWVSAELIGGQASPPGVAPRGLPAKAGPFTIHDLPEGAYELRVKAMVGGTRRFARVRFATGAGTADLGEVGVTAGATVRARVVGADGRPAEGSILSMRPESPGWRGTDEVLLEDAASRGFLEEGGEGWFRFDDLFPGTPYVLEDPVLPGVRAVVETPGAGGAPLVVEVPWTGRWVKCRLRFTAGGASPGRWASFWSPAVPPSLWKGDGNLEMELASGTHPVSAVIEAPEGGVLYFRGAIPVPEAPGYEATIDLQPVEATSDPPETR